MQRLLFLLLLQFLITDFFAQEIPISNPSFEGTPRHSSLPEGWNNFGFKNESLPDIHPSGAFQIIKPAAHGETYLGLVARDNDTWEGVHQELSFPLIQGATYQLMVYLAKSPQFLSISKTSQQPAQYTEACITNYIAHPKPDTFRLNLEGLDPATQQYYLYEWLYAINKNPFSGLIQSLVRVDLLRRLHARKPSQNWVSEIPTENLVQLSSDFSRLSAKKEVKLIKRIIKIRKSMDQTRQRKLNSLYLRLGEQLSSDALNQQLKEWYLQQRPQIIEEWIAAWYSLPP